MLVFSHAWEDAEGKRDHETLVTVHIGDHGDKTKLTCEQAIFEAIESRDSHAAGWTECLERLGDYLAKRRIQLGTR